MNPPLPSTNRPSGALPFGFAFIYLAWGGTYLGVKFAIVDFPVFLMSGFRFLLAGILLFTSVALLDRSGFHRGTLREWKDAGGIGLLLLVFGIGTGNWAQQYVDSSFAAMVFSGLSLWIILIDWIRPGGSAPARTVVIGLLWGFIGIGIILVPTGEDGIKTMNFALNLLLVLASICWASGAIFSRHIHARGSALLAVARQMIVAGMVLILVGCVHGDLNRLDLVKAHTTAWIGFIYLVLIGSLGGYPVYLWLMRICSPAKAATIPYVNLIVAIFLGWSLGHEAITPRLLFGTALVLISVAIVLRTKAPEAIPPDD